VGFFSKWRRWHGWAETISEQATTAQAVEAAFPGHHELIKI